MRSAFRLYVLLPLLIGAAAVPMQAEAQQDRVWVDCRHGNAMCTKDLDAVVTAWHDAGASEVVVSTELPSDISDGSFRLLVMLLPTVGLEISEMNVYLPGFLGGDGRLVLLAENSSETLGNQNISDILDSISGNSISLGAIDTNPGCTNSTNNIPADPLTSGLSTWHFARAGEVIGGDPLIRYTRSDNGQVATLAAVSRLSSGEVVVIADIEGFVASCLAEEGLDFSADHTPFWMNLFADSSLASDNDGDGYDSFTDCDDADAAVHPDAEEICDGLDNNCDGEVDEGFDEDGDGVSICEGDCDDTNPDIFPGSPEICDGIDNDCDPETDEHEDNDGDGVSPCGSCQCSGISPAHCSDPEIEGQGACLEAGDCTNTNFLTQETCVAAGHDWVSQNNTWYPSAPIDTCSSCVAAGHAWVNDNGDSCDDNCLSDSGGWDRPGACSCNSLFAEASFGHTAWLLMIGLSFGLRRRPRRCR